MFKKFMNKLFGSKTVVDNAISFKQGFDLTELPVITLSQGNKKFNFLLDTGSNDSIINKAALLELEYEEEGRKSHLFGLEGRKQEVSYCNIALSYKDQVYKYSYLISDMTAAFGQIKQATGVNLDGIIGSKFFNEFKYVLDFDSLIAYSKQ